jgi:glycine cleavage system H protein
MKSPRTAHEVLPAGAERCVWMGAGLVAYKLCDRGFDCEHCPLDLGLHGATRDTPSQAMATKRAPWGFPEDLHFGPGHLWTRPAGDGRLRLGIDTLVTELAPDVLGVHLLPVGAKAQAGDPLVRLETAAGDLTLLAPCACTVRMTNETVRSRPSLLTSDPYGEGWLLEVAPVGASAEEVLQTWWPAPEAMRRARLDLQRFQRKVAMELLTSPADLGATMCDGGERVTDLRQMLGDERHLRLVGEILGATSPA